MRETRDRDRQIIEHTSPLWRLIGVVVFFAGIGFIGYGFQVANLEDQFATIAVVASFVSVGIWARQRPDKFRARFGPFGKVAAAAQESADDIRAYVHNRTMRVAVPLAILYGIAVAVAQSLVVALLETFYAWPLAVGVGAIIGGLVAAPDFFKGAYKSMSVPDDEDLEEPLEEDLEDEDELSRRRRASGEE